MSRTSGFALALGVALLAAGATGANAQACRESIGEATGASRDGALRQAYEGMLHGLSDNTWRQWMARGQRIGDVPGYTLRKLSTNCTPRGAGMFCRVTGFACRA